MFLAWESSWNEALYHHGCYGNIAQVDHCNLIVLEYLLVWLGDTDSPRAFLIRLLPSIPPLPPPSASIHPSLTSSLPFHPSLPYLLPPLPSIPPLPPPSASIHPSLTSSLRFHPSLPYLLPPLPSIPPLPPPSPSIHPSLTSSLCFHPSLPYLLPLLPSIPPLPPPSPSIHPSLTCFPLHELTSAHSSCGWTRVSWVW